MLREDVEQAKRDGLIGTVVQDGACRFCGQSKKVETIIGWTEDQCDELATETCNCDEAEKYAYKKGQKERAYALIQKQFVECQDNPPLPDKVVNLLNEAVEILAAGTVKSITIDNGTGIKAKVSVTAKGKIKVERTDTEKNGGEA